jgi:NAD(P)-dependent dehydrogenase (short-subunit alcohol dehydrogenase family)
MKKVLITGADGGMGRSVARLFGFEYELYLTDIKQDRLNAFAQSLTDDGYQVGASLAGNLSDPDFARSAVAKARESGPLNAVVHTAGLSPALADWEGILRVNTIASEHFLQALEEGLEPGLVAVLIASIAGHVAIPDADIDSVFEAPLANDFLQRAKPLLDKQGAGFAGVEGVAYNQSKRWVRKTVERRAREWGKSGARICSISPGLIDTPMGRSEMDKTQGVANTLEATTMGWGRPTDIAGAAAFLCSDQARYITGTDLRVDGGVTPVFALFLKHMADTKPAE